MDTSSLQYANLKQLYTKYKNYTPEQQGHNASLKNITNVINDDKDVLLQLSIIFVGHVDAGKSTFCGQILLLAGEVTDAEIRKLKMDAKEKNHESWWMTYIMDSDNEERTKGITIEVGKAHFSTTKKRITILDAPGHKNYIPKMIAGAVQADVAMLIISARTNEFESGFIGGGQTAEHAILTKSLGVRYLVILINKMDEVDWLEKRYNAVKNQLEPFIKQLYGQTYEKRVFWLPCSGLHGHNINTNINALASWYNGKCLFEILDEIPDRVENSKVPLIRLPIHDVDKENNNICLSVKVENGAIYPGQKLALLPCGEEITINSIYDDDDKCRPCATIGESVKLYIKGDLSILKGHMLSSLYNLPYICSEIEVDIYIIDLHQHKPIFTKGYECIMHMNSLTENVFIKEIKSVYNATKKLFEPVKFLKKGARGICVLVIKNNEPFVCDKYQQNLKTGSFVLRDEDRTIAFCKILRVKPIFT